MDQVKSVDVDQTYELLEKNNVVVPKHLRTILTSLNYIGLHVLATLDNVEDMNEIETSVVSILAADDRTADKTEEELRNLFGDFYWKTPTKFKLLPGDKKMLRVIASVSQKIITSQPLISQLDKKGRGVQQSTHQRNKHVPFPKGIWVYTISKENNNSIYLIYSGATSGLTSSKSDTHPLKTSEVEIMDESETSPPVLSLTETITRWGNNKRIEGFEKLFSVKDRKIRCHFQRGQSSSSCGKEFSSSRDSKGFWKISNFSNHFRSHFIDKAGQQPSRSALKNFLLKGIN